MQKENAMINFLSNGLRSSKNNKNNKKTKPTFEWMPKYVILEGKKIDVRSEF